MDDIVYSKDLYVILAAQPHMREVRHQLVFLCLIRASRANRGTVYCFQAHINDTLSLRDDPLLGKLSILQSPF